MRKLINAITEAVSDFFRMLFLKDYSKIENCRTAIINSIEKEKNEVDKFTIQAECKIRYYQIMAFWLLLPVVVLLLPVLTAFNHLFLINKPHPYIFDLVIIQPTPLWFVRGRLARFNGRL
jgi:hypothetical protein